MENFEIIGVSGRARAGKDTVAGILCDHIGYKKTLRCAFADPLKRECAEFLASNTPQQAQALFGEWTGLDKETLLEIFGDVYQPSYDLAYEDDRVDWNFRKHGNPWDVQVVWIESLMKGDKYKGRFRKLLQYWGTEYRRTQDEQYWLKAWETTVGEMRSKYPLISTVVVPDLRFKNEYNFLLSKGAKLIRVEREMENNAGSHASETSLDKEEFWDVIIYNDGDLDALKNKVVTAYDFWQEDGA